MGLFDFFKPAPRINDPVFGTMVYNGGFAIAKVASLQLGREMEVLVDCSASGPTPIQHQMFEGIINNHQDLLVKCEHAITEEFLNVREDFKINSFYEEFELVAISIPTRSEEEWSMAFTTDHDLNHQFEVHFMGGDPTHVLIDG